MASMAEYTSTKVNFPGPIGTKRRRMRSGGNVSTLSTDTKQQMMQDDNISEEKTTQTSKCKGAATIPIFLKKTYKMIDTCDPKIASWTPEGDMFVVKDPDLFATQVIPQYFDHNKFSSFARQLNFYGFRKMQSKPIRNSDFDAITAKHVTFYNEHFKRGRCDLLKMIQRSTRGGTTTPGQDSAKDLQNLREQVSMLEQRITDMDTQYEERLRRLELEMLARMEQMMLTVQQQQQQTQMQLQKSASVGSTSAPPSGSQLIPSWGQNNMAYFRGTSINSTNSIANSVGINSVNGGMNSVNGGPSRSSAPSPNPNGANVNGMNGTHAGYQPQLPQSKMQAPSLPPHPKQKQGLPLPLNGLSAMGAPPDRLNSLRGISALTRGLSRGASIESSASAVLMRNSWEDKFFSMLMLDGNDQSGAAANALINPTPIGVVGNSITPGTQPVVSNRSVDFNDGSQSHEGDLSSVSSSDIP